MRSQAEDDNLMTRYLLGAASAEEQSAVEERFFRDADFHFRLLAVEQEIICDYVRGQLPPNEAELFEHHYLASPPRRRKYEQTRELLARLAVPEPQDPIL